MALEASKGLSDVVEAILKQHLSVRQTEAMVAGMLNPEVKPKKKKGQAWVADANVREAQVQLQRRLGLRVEIDDRGGKGRVIIAYAGVDDFDAILRALGE